MSGQHFLQIPGPSPVPERVLRAMAVQVIDHRGPTFQALGRDVLEGVRAVFGTSGPVVIFPGSGTGAWEAAIVNTLSPGDRVLMAETGQFATLWHAMAKRWGLAPEECAAFGDGGNDVPMFGCVGVSVAMGNAADDVKAAATMVAPDVDDDGLLVACRELGLA